MKKILLILFLCFIISIQGMAITYTSQYPTEYSDTTVKATSKFNTTYWHYHACNPALSLVGWGQNEMWLSGSGNETNQRFHIDLGSAKIIRRIYYENGHQNGNYESNGIQNFTFQGSNTASGTFDDLVYANDEGWTNLSTAQGTFDQHDTGNNADPNYITVTNTTAYRYYAFKFADHWGGALAYQTLRRVELQTEDGFGAAEDNAIFFGFNF